MRFLYGKQEFCTMERGQENCFLLTNGLGGFSSCTMIGSNSRNDHAFLMACTKAPNHRFNLVNRLSEVLYTGGERYWISSQQFEDGSEETGYKNQVSFAYEDVPQWHYKAGAVEILKVQAMEHNFNTAAVSYHIRNTGNTAAEFTVTPYFQFVRKGEDLKKTQAFLWEKGKIESEGMTLFYGTNGREEPIPPVYETQYYAYDRCDGRRETGNAMASHRIILEIPAGGEKILSLVYSMEPVKKSGDQVAECMKIRRRTLETTAGFSSEAAAMLSKSADQFIAERESTGGKTILAGYPFFEDWGRDTMIALPGCTLSTGQFETAKSILRTFMANEKKGLMPNLFPEGGNEPAYNTADAALLFINCVYLYYEKTGDLEFVREAKEVMSDILKWYQEGTDYGIHMDDDGLLMAGRGFDQVTWMDVRIGDILPTPRHGKPVEINAYWYNALCIMKIFEELTGGEFSLYEERAKQVKASFIEKFWMEEKNCLKDVVSGNRADAQIRCNQIWAVSLPFIMLTQDQGKAVVQTVFEKLYTPYGLRTLTPEDEEFKPCYGGPQSERDLAYHQGTVWTFPLGAYYLSYLRVHSHSEEAVSLVKKQLETMECAMREGCIGQLPEIYDGLFPAASKGCFAQAWSVGELLRVYEQIETQQLQLNHREMELIKWKKS